MPNVVNLTMKKLIYFIIGLILGFTVCFIWPCKDAINLNPTILELKSQVDSLQGCNRHLIDSTEHLTIELSNYKDDLEKLRKKPFKTRIDTVLIIEKQDSIINKQDTVIRNWEKIHIINTETIQGQAEIINRQDDIIIKQQKIIDQKSNKQQFWKWSAIIEAGIIVVLVVI